MTSFEEAQKIVLDNMRPIEAVEVPLRETLGLVLAEDTVSKESVPPFDNSAMDGFAIVASDTIGATARQPVRLTVLEDEPAGRVSRLTVATGTAIRIMTGAPVPKGADAVVEKESTREAGDAVEVMREVKVGENLRRAGEDIKTGELVIPAGSEVRAPEMGVLASLGRATVRVFRRPRVAILTTGDELVDIDQPLEPGRIRSSNSYSLYAQCLRAEAEPITMGIVPDTADAVTDRLNEAKRAADVILTTGGVSVGEYDVVKDVLSAMGADLKFWKVAQKPGKPFAFWMLKGKPVFGLPGNPVATMVCFEEYVRPYLRKATGHRKLFRPVVEAILEENIKKKPGRMHFVRVMVTEREGRLWASTTGPQGSGILKSMVLANGLALVPSEITLLKAGETVRVQMVDWPEDH